MLVTLLPTLGSKTARPLSWGPSALPSEPCVLGVPVLRWGDQESGGQLTGLWATVSPPIMWLGDFRVRDKDTLVFKGSLEVVFKGSLEVSAERLYVNVGK